MDLIEKAKEHWFVGIVSIAIICISISWVVFYELFVKPRDFLIEQQEKKVTELKEKITGYETKYPDQGPENSKTIKAEGKIARPYNDEEVTMEFSFEVRITRHNPHKHYYLANEVYGLYWPKFKITPDAGNGKITGQIVEAGNPPGRIFHLVLLEVDENEDREISRWFLGKEQPGIRIVGNVLDRIKLKLK